MSLQVCWKTGKKLWKKKERQRKYNFKNPENQSLLVYLKISLILLITQTSGSFFEAAL